MPYVETMDLVINDLSEADAKVEALKWWSFMNGGGASDTVDGQLSPTVLAHPLYKPAAGGVDAHFEFYSSPNPVEVAGAYSTKAQMDADLDSVSGTLVNCFDPDSTKRGRYSKSGASGSGSWGRVSATIEDKFWSDYNHPQRLLELAICSWARTLTPLPYMGSQQGWVGPADGDWRGARIFLDLEFDQVELGPRSKFGLHCQGNVDRVADALTAEYGEGDKYFLPNQIQRVSLISDPLGFGDDSWGIPNDVPISRASGRRVIEITMSPDDNDWVGFGDPGRSPVGRIINYGYAPVSEVLENLIGNIYLLAHHPAPKEGGAWWSKSSAESVSDFDRFKGRIRMYGVRIEALT